MFRWYKEATVCYVYLADVTPITKVALDATWEAKWEASFRRSRWFTRGWTLQELIAPKSVRFFAHGDTQDLTDIGSKSTLESFVSAVTRLPVDVLRGADVDQYSVEERLTWCKGRQTKRKEDGAYCLLGLFGIFMPLIYGEGENAYERLMEHIEAKHEKQAKLSSSKRLLLEARNVRTSNSAPLANRAQEVTIEEFSPREARCREQSDRALAERLALEEFDEEFDEEQADASRTLHFERKPDFEPETKNATSTEEQARELIYDEEPPPRSRDPRVVYFEASSSQRRAPRSQSGTPSRSISGQQELSRERKKKPIDGKSDSISTAERRAARLPAMKPIDPVLTRHPRATSSPRKQGLFSKAKDSLLGAKY